MIQQVLTASWLGDVLIFSLLLAGFFMLTHFKSQLWILRFIFAFLIAHPFASVLSGLKVFNGTALEGNFLAFFAILLAVLLFALRKLHFNFSYGNLLAKFFLALTLTLIVVLFFVSNFNPSFFVYDAFAAYKTMILSNLYVVAVYSAFIIALTLL